MRNSLYTGAAVTAANLALPDSLLSFGARVAVAALAGLLSAAAHKAFMALWGYLSRKLRP